MLAGLTNQGIDLSVVVIGNLANLLMIGIFLARAAAGTRGPVEHALGWILEVLSLPLVLAIVLNAVRSRGPWLSVLPTFLVAFLLVELILDYVYHNEFRRTRWPGPYLGLYYVALMGMIDRLRIHGKPLLRLHHACYLFPEPAGYLVFVYPSRPWHPREMAGVGLQLFR